MIEGSYSGPIPDEHDNGGTCALTLASGRFELTLAGGGRSSTDDGGPIRGTYTEHTGRITLEATTPVPRSFVASVGVDEATGLIALRMRIDIGAPFETRLLAGIPTVGDGPRTLVEIGSELRRVEWESRAYWNRFSAAEFFAPLAADAWSPADHVRHLTKSIQPITIGLRVPKFAIRLLFGTPRRPSHSFAAMRAQYLAALQNGISAGRFAPRPMGLAEQDDATRQQVMTRHGEAVENLAAAIARWDERASDTCRLPHPALGKLTVREMLYFTLYHNVHHVHVAERRRHSAG